MECCICSIMRGTAEGGATLHGEVYFKLTCCERDKNAKKEWKEQKEKERASTE